MSWVYQWRGTRQPHVFLWREGWERSLCGVYPHAEDKPMSRRQGNPCSRCREVLRQMKVDRDVQEFSTVRR